MEPRDFARVVLKRKRTVATALIVAVASVFFASLRATPSYVAECRVLFQAAGLDVTQPDRFIETVGTLESNADLIRSPEISRPVAEALQIDDLGIVDVEILPDTQIFRLTVVDQGKPHPLADQGVHTEWTTSPGQRAADICNEYGNEYIAFKKGEARQAFEGELVSKEASLLQRKKEFSTIERQRQRAERNGNFERELELEIRRNTLLLRISDLQGEIVGLREQLEDGIDGGGRLIQPAEGGALVAADLKKNLLMGLIVGLMFGIGIALVREYLDDTVKDKDSTQRELGVPVLASLPAGDDIEGMDEPSPATIEAARNLRTTLSSLGFPHEKNTLLVTSTLTKRRATTLASLAAAVAESGRSVLVIGSDLRSGRTHEAFGIHNTVGLANVVRGQVPFEKAIRPAPGIEGVYVMPAGPIIGNPGELLSSEAMALTLRRARRWADVVLLDAPPVLAAADSSILGAYADGVLLVASVGQTNRAQANEAKEQLIAAGSRVIGVVLVGGEDNNHDGLGDELTYGSFGDWGGYGGDPMGPSDPGAGVDQEPWFDDSLTMTAYTEPQAPRPRRSPPKKTAASRPGQRPARRRSSVPRNGVRTKNGRKPRSTAARTTKKSSTTRKTSKTKKATRTPTRSTSAKKRSTSTSRSRTTKR